MRTTSAVERRGDKSPDSWLYGYTLDHPTEWIAGPLRTGLAPRSSMQHRAAAHPGYHHHALHARLPGNQPRDGFMSHAHLFWYQVTTNPQAKDRGQWE
ncbi:unnamed protein product [Cutaneotrichosporon oleaginosum]